MNVIIISFLLMFACISVMDARRGESAVYMSCQNDWILNNGHCYFFGRVQKNWFQAKSYCRGQRANLVKVDDIAEHVWLAMLMKEFGSNDMWIGANDHAKEGQYRWVSDDSRVSFTKWDRNQPDDFSNEEDCVQIWNRSNGYQWNDCNCSSRINFMCEK